MLLEQMAYLAEYKCIENQRILHFDSFELRVIQMKQTPATEVEDKQHSDLIKCLKIHNEVRNFVEVLEPPKMEIFNKRIEIKPQEITCISRFLHMIFVIRGSLQHTTD